MSNPFKVALVWNAPFQLNSISTRFEPYVEGLRILGVEATTVCPAGTEIGYEYPVRTFASEAELLRGEFWRELGCHAMVIISWHRMTDIIRGAMSAGVKVLAIGESDGMLSLRDHPRETFMFMTLLQSSWRGKLGAARYWLKRYMFLASLEEKKLVDNAEAPSIFTLAGEGAVHRFQRFLKRYGATSLADRIEWLPYPVSREFCNTSVKLTRPRSIIAIGRWDSPQKNSRLLASTIQTVVADPKPTEVIIVGSGSERFEGLFRGEPLVRIMGPQPRERVRELMAECRSVLIPSRWESGPIVASEMLSLGGTVIGTPIPNLQALTKDNRFGRVASSHRPAALASAVQQELAAWESSERDPELIARYWRLRVSPESVATKIVRLLGL